MKLIIITPVRNEETFIGTTLNCMLNQTTSPYKWIIVDDGSTDQTAKIIKEYQKRVSYISYIYREDRGYRKPGKGVIDTFYEGYKEIKDDQYDIISKFDADLQFSSDFLERIIKKFQDNPKLGITGPTEYERSRRTSEFKRVIVPKGFVGGPFKFYRKECFEDIGGLINRAGWDGVDNIRANMKGWETGEIKDLKINHLRTTGTAKGEGLIKACEKYGDVSYYMGGYFWYFLFRMIGRGILSRNGKVSYYMLKGYLKSMRTVGESESIEFRKFLKRRQIENTVDYFQRLCKSIF